MTEDEWLVCADPHSMLIFLGSRASHRKLQLFACAGCRRLYGLFPNAMIQRAVEFGEQDADGLGDYQEMIEARAEIAHWIESQDTGVSGRTSTSAEMSAVTVASGLLSPAPRTRARLAGEIVRYVFNVVHAVNNDRRAVIDAPAGEEVRVARATWQAAQAACAREQQALAALLRDIIRNPFQPIIDDLIWRRPDVDFLAQTIYDELPGGKMPNLAEALFDAGCDNEDMLSHCRSAGPHVRGCWVIDLVLGKK